MFKKLSAEEIRNLSDEEFQKVDFDAHEITGETRKSFEEHKIYLQNAMNISKIPSKTQTQEVQPQNIKILNINNNNTLDSTQTSKKRILNQINAENQYNSVNPVKHVFQ